MVSNVQLEGMWEEEESEVYFLTWSIKILSWNS